MKKDRTGKFSTLVSLALLRMHLCWNHPSGGTQLPKEEAGDRGPCTEGAQIQTMQAKLDTVPTCKHLACSCHGFGAHPLFSGAFVNGSTGRNSALR